MRWRQGVVHAPAVAAKHDIVVVPIADPEDIRADAVARAREQEGAPRRREARLRTVVLP